MKLFQFVIDTFLAYLSIFVKTFVSNLQVFCNKDEAHSINFTSNQLA